jgi:hypothetical protein
MRCTGCKTGANWGYEPVLFLCFPLVGGRGGIYYEEPDLPGGIEGIDDIMEYGVNCEDDEEEA